MLFYACVSGKLIPFTCSNKHAQIRLSAPLALYGSWVIVQHCAVHAVPLSAEVPESPGGNPHVLDTGSWNMQTPHRIRCPDLGRKLNQPSCCEATALTTIATVPPPKFDMVSPQSLLKKLDRLAPYG